MNSGPITKSLARSVNQFTYILPIDQIFTMDQRTKLSSSSMRDNVNEYNTSYHMI